ncbi:MAG: GlsB/YeaQ/YmgE family stress response membrane protein [Hyphomicrobiales bacterium]|nr:GlsB/YeaQ/YmgE family stress response membrane protein [Hyphomicrobiales bacterium]
MDFVSIVILMCIGNAAGWLTFLYIEGGGVGLIQGVVLGLLGAFVGGILLAQGLPQYGVVSVMIGGAFGAVFLILLVRSLLVRGSR